MYELISNLILYGNLPEDEILVQLAKLLSDDEKESLICVNNFKIEIIKEPDA